MKIYTLFFLAAAMFVMGCSPETAPFSSAAQEQTPKSGTIVLQGDTTQYDFGTVAIDNGLLESDPFTFTNAANEPLVLWGGSTSCGCTTGVLQVGEQTYPFSMGNDLTEATTIAPGQDFTIRVVYDPIFHGPDYLGERTQSVYLQTSVPPEQAGTSPLLRPYPLDPSVVMLEIPVMGTVVAAE